MVSHDIAIHQTTQETLHSLDSSTRERITDTLIDVAENRQPTSHSKCELLDGQELLKVRVGDYRVLVDLVKPSRELRVVLIDRRKSVYDNLETAKMRARG